MKRQRNDFLKEEMFTLIQMGCLIHGFQTVTTGAHTHQQSERAKGLFILSVTMPPQQQRDVYLMHFIYHFSSPFYMLQQDHIWRIWSYHIIPYHYCFYIYLKIQYMDNLRSIKNIDRCLRYSQAHTHTPARIVIKILPFTLQHHYYQKIIQI